jgi:hypothetical protein
MLAAPASVLEYSPNKGIFATVKIGDAIINLNGRLRFGTVLSIIDALSDIKMVWRNLADIGG